MKMAKTARRGIVWGVTLSVCTFGGADAAQEPGSPDNGAHMYDGLGSYGRAITTDSDEAQRWFNQGMQLMYGFNHDEAIRSFERAAQADDSAAMAWWGIAYCHGININDPEMRGDRSRLAREAADEAIARLDTESAVEQALVMAVSARYVFPAPEDRFPLDEAYARAMGDVHTRFLGDADVGALYGEALMNLQPWDYWTPDGTPKGRIEEVVSVLEGAMEADPGHPGAKHFYIHAVEASKDPARALAAAEALTDLVPGAGHLVHMPSHIFIRVGRYQDAVASNLAAIDADRRYFSVAPEPQMYAMYYAHNLHLLSFASMMSGDFETALRAARSLEREVPEAPLREFAGLIEGIMPSTLHVLIRFGKWEQILEEPDYADWRLMSRATRFYARSIACSALGRTEQAHREMGAFEEAVAAVPEDWMVFNNSVHDVLPIARAMIRGELLFREGKREEAFAVLREGIAHEDTLVYDEPPAWMLPVRHTLGALLMADGQFKEAERLYREDLERNIRNGWALTGLRESLVAQGRTGEAEACERLLEVAFAGADTEVTSSCLCEP